jgi:hypothetical protein
VNVENVLSNPTIGSILEHPIRLFVKGKVSLEFKGEIVARRNHL